MAIIYATGFDIFTNITEFLETGWFRESATQNTLSTNAGRFGGGCLSGSLTSGSNGWWSSVSIAAGSTLHLAFAYFHNAGTVTDDLFVLNNYATNQSARITLSPTGVLQSFNRSNTLVGTSASNPLTPGAWHWVEIKVTNGSLATDGEISMRVNGSLVLNTTGIDTRPNGSAQTVGMFMLSGPRDPTGATVRIDDLFVMDTTGTVFNGFMADRRIQTLTPNADGGVVDWAASSGTDVSCVDDALSAQNGDTDYIESSTPGQESRFALSNLPVSPASVDAVMIKLCARKSDAGDRTVRGLVNSSSSEAVGSAVGLTTTYGWKSSGVFLTNPNGSVAWTESAVNALEAGVEVVS